MQKRLFVAISLPEDIKKRLFRLIETEYRSLPAKWSRPENLHLTLLFLGFVQEEKIPDICEAIRNATNSMPELELDFKRIETGPKKESPKMIWVTGEENDVLNNLKHSLEKEVNFSLQGKSRFIPHITLGRIKRKEWAGLAQAPDISRDFNFSFGVGSVELLESKYEKGKRIYYVMESFPLK